MSEVFLTYSELSARLKVNRSTVVRWAADGTIPAPAHVGGVRRFKLADIEKWEAGLQGQPPGPTYAPALSTRDE